MKGKRLRAMHASTLSVPAGHIRSVRKPLSLVLDVQVAYPSNMQLARYKMAVGSDCLNNTNLFSREEEMNNLSWCYCIICAIVFTGVLQNVSLSFI